MNVGVSVWQRFAVSRGRQPSLSLQSLLFVLAGRVSRHQQAVIEHLQSENQLLREQLGNKRLVWTDAQRRRLAKKAKTIGRSVLTVLGTVVTPDTLLRWYCMLVAAQYDGSKKRGSGRPRRKRDIAKLVIRMATENPSWGYNLGHDIARNIKDAGVNIVRLTGAKSKFEFLRGALDQEPSMGVSQSNQTA